ncbi:hypothetical protein [Ulvibacterium marinum]|uniref:hypothetical protein n=1 Tax=Ulvibacterium marinum TaxID=2419782 RepID=UPI002494C934|nr:hypothetical protein [Ulvibacterium marinum]
MKITMITIFLALTFASCNEELNFDDRTNADKIVGNWLTHDIELSLDVAGVALLDYLTGSLGYSTTEANTIQMEIEAYYVANLTGTLDIMGDGTFASAFSDIVSGGTWSIAADDKTVTLLEFSDETVEFTIVIITTESMVVTIGDDFSHDLDEDPTTPNEIITANAVVTFDRR